MDIIEENPWKLKGRIKFISCCDVLLQSFGILYTSYQMFTYYMFIGSQPGVNEIMKGPGHIPFYIFVWFTLTLHYVWIIVIALVLCSAVSLEATETDPHTSIQKCQCWLRTARLNLFIVFVRLCLQPVLLYLEKTTYLFGILVGVVEFVFRATAICWVRMFMQDLQSIFLHILIFTTKYLQGLAVGISSYIGFQTTHGAELIPGNSTETEKLTRLVVYAAVLLLFLGAQLLMAIRLMRTSKLSALESVKEIAMWLEWSIVFILFLAIHGGTALLLMNGGPRKTTIMIISTIQLLFRLSGIGIVSKFYYIVPEPMKNEV